MRAVLPMRDWRRTRMQLVGLSSLSRVMPRSGRYEITSMNYYIEICATLYLVYLNDLWSKMHVIVTDIWSQIHAAGGNWK